MKWKNRNVTFTCFWCGHVKEHTGPCPRCGNPKPGKLTIGQRKSNQQK